ncbi:MAG: phosphoribosylanthranilate isomerase [Bacteroidota bacterium]|nr:phosphoribosylanthranilate isomerase [Bacteroidota bacterium]
MKIKVCGMKYSENISEVIALKPDMMGFIFYPKSPRYAEPLDEEFMCSFPRNVLKIGVFVNEELDNILEVVKKYNLNGVQLHGAESEDMCYTFRQTGLLTLKAFSIAEPADFDKTEDYEGTCDLYVFDTKTPQHGGSGQKFDWSILSAYQGNTPFLLSGGIGPDDADAIKAINHPMLRGVDLNSRFETEPGRKDASRLENFLKELKS